MIVLMLEHVSEKIRGECTKYLLEIKPGIYLGTITSQVRALLWDMICNEGNTGGAMIAYSTNNEQGFKIESFGDPSREIDELDGVQLIRYKTENIHDTKMVNRINFPHK